MSKSKSTATGMDLSNSSWSDSDDRVDKDSAHLSALEAKETSETPGPISFITLPKLELGLIKVRIVGDSPLICHRWSQKAKEAMLAKQMGKATAGKVAKNPEQDYHESLYHYPGGGYGFPTIAFKNAAVSACTSLGKAITKVAARQSFHIMGELTKIEGEPRPREDMVRVGMGTADIRYRGEFPEWRTTLLIRYNSRVLSEEQILNLFNIAGFAVGVGEWRSEKDGSYGLFHVE